MDLADLKTTVSNLSDEELLGLIKNIRSSRRVSKVSKNNKPRATTRKTSDISIDSMLRSIPADQLEQLINALETEAGK